MELYFPDTDDKISVTNKGRPQISLTDELLHQTGTVPKSDVNLGLDLNLSEDRSQQRRSQGHQGQQTGQRPGEPAWECCLGEEAVAAWGEGLWVLARMKACLAWG